MDAGSVNELSRRLSCMPLCGIEYHPGSTRLVVLRKAGAAFSFYAGADVASQSYQKITGVRLRNPNYDLKN